MPSLPLYTYADAIDHALAFLGSQSSGDAARDARRAVQNAYREFASIRKWTYYYQRGRVTTVASYSTGTITYTHSTRSLTLASGTWPSWAAYGTVVISDVAYEVASRSSDSVIVLSVNSNPGANVAAGTSYTLYRDTYPLPADFLAIDQPEKSGGGLPSYCHPTDWLVPQSSQNTPGTPARFTIMADPNYLGVLAMRFNPPPSTATTYDFVYVRRPRPLLIDSYSTGTVTGSLDGTTLTGTSTVWTDKHIGCVIRLSTGSTDAPTGLAGLNVYGTERVITSRASATSLTIDSALTEAYTGVKYTISDPVDLEEGAMLTAFQRCVEKQVAISRNMKTKGEYMQAYQLALLYAMDADSRSFSRRVVCAGDSYPRRLADYPGAITNSG